MAGIEGYEYKLLVEGNDEKQFLKSLFKAQEQSINFDIIDSGSIFKVKTELKIRLKSSNDTKALGVIIDADNNLDSAWQSIRDILVRSKKYNPPEVLPSDGLVLPPNDESDIIVGVWIMPNNCDIGMLEDFLARNIPNDDKLMPYVDKTMTEIEEQGINEYKAVHKPKARIHNWLAWQEPPGCPMGIAVTKRLFDLDAELCRSFVSWTERLFKID